MKNLLLSLLNSGHGATGDTVIGGTGVGIVEVVQHTPTPDNVSTLAIQLFIALVSLVSVIIRQRKARKKESDK